MININKEKVFLISTIVIIVGVVGTLVCLIIGCICLNLINNSIKNYSDEDAIKNINYYSPTSLDNFLLSNDHLLFDDSSPGYIYEFNEGEETKKNSVSYKSIDEINSYILENVNSFSLDKTIKCTERYDDFSSYAYGRDENLLLSLDIDNNSIIISSSWHQDKVIYHGEEHNVNVDVNAYSTYSTSEEIISGILNKINKIIN